MVTHLTTFLSIFSLIIACSRHLEGGAACYAAPTVLASSVEILWVPNPSGPTALPRKPHLTQALWLCCGSHGTRFILLNIHILDWLHIFYLL